MNKVVEKILEMRHKGDSSYIYHLGRKSIYYVNGLLKIKQDSGEWVEGISYSECFEGEIYARVFDQFKEESWSVLNTIQASDQIQHIINERN